MSQSDLDILLTCDGQGRAAKREALARLRAPERTVLVDLLAVLKARAVGHVVMYSDRVTPFIARIEEVLKS